MNPKHFLRGLLLGASVAIPYTFVSLYNKQKSGEVWSWGFGRNGELGIGSETNISLPQLIKNYEFVDIDAKKSLSAGITADGKLMTWGKNRNGVLGHIPINLNVLVPREVEIREDISNISLGYQNLCVITQKGDAFVWGLQQIKSKFRAIGTAETQKAQNIPTPTKINLKNVAQAACANDYIVFLNKSGKVFVLGDTQVKGVNHVQAKTKNDIIQLGLSNIKKISSGINFSLALTDDGKVYVWGNNTYGQLGTGGLKSLNQPVLLQALSKQKIIDISCGDNYTGIVTEQGQVYTWGFGNEGQLGHGDKSDQFLPRKIVNLKGEKIKTISCGGAHTALLAESGKLLMMGRGREGQLGRQQKDQSNSGYSLQVKQVEQLPNDKNILKVACGGNHTLILLQKLI